MKFRQNILFVILIYILVSLNGCSSLTANDIIHTINEQGNTNGNIHEGGYVVIRDGWIYYTNTNDNDNLYKKKIDGSNNIELSSGHYSYNINVLGDWIYYISGAPGYVFKVTKDGQNKEKIINKKVENLIIADQNIFYRLSYDNDWGKLYKTDLNGNKEVLLANKVLEFSINGGLLYYSNIEDNYSLYKMDFNGDNIEKLSEGYISSIDIDEEYIYYSDHHDGNKLYRIKKDGTDKTIISQNACWNVNLYGDYIYYRNQSDKGSIYRVKKDGSDNIKIIDGNCSRINVTDSFILYYRITEGSGYFKSNLDGSNIQPWVIS